MRLAKTTALIACLAAAFLGGCGSSDDKGKQIPAATRVELDKRLNSIRGRFDFGGGACADIAKDQASVQQTLDALPSNVDTDVKNALNDGFARLFELTDSQCDAKKGQQTDTQPTAPTPPPVDTQTTESTPTTPTDSTPQSTTPQQTTPKKTKPPKGNGGGNSAPQSGNGGAGVAPGELP